MTTARFLVICWCALVGALQSLAQINAEQVVKVGQNALYFDDYMLSIQYFNQAIQAKPYMARPYFLRAIAKLNLEDYYGAQEDATLAIDRNPFIADAWEVRGVARQNLGLLRGCVQDYDKALELLPGNRSILFNKALALSELGESDSALVTFDNLLKKYPGYENGYVGRARLLAQEGDTLRARADLSHALELNKNLANAYLLRAQLTIADAQRLNQNKSHHSRNVAPEQTKLYEQAQEDMSEGIRLMPREVGLYINRAFLRYELDDYFGAMADYDYALTLDPVNVPALFNRALLRMETRDFDRAVGDLTRVLELDPTDYRALYNRAVAYGEKRATDLAITDVNAIIEGLPDLPEAYYMRSDLHRTAGRMAQAERDYKKALQLSQELFRKHDAEKTLAATPSLAPEENTPRTSESEGTPEEMSPETVARRFAQLRTIDNTLNLDDDHNNRSIRGRVQDRDQRIQTEPMFVLNYYNEPTQLRPTAYYMKEVDDVNATRQLRMVVMLTPDGKVTLDNESDINRHFASIEYYTSLLATHAPRAIDYFGRAMDYVMLRNYGAAQEDLTRAIALTPDFALAYFERALTRFKALQASENPLNVEMRLVIADFDRALELSPNMAFALYNKGNVFAAMQDYTSALAAYNQAIQTKPDLGEAYYNRGYVYFQLGDRERGSADLSRAGELGVVPSYNLLKRMK